MRATTAFKRLLRLRGASILDVSFAVEGMIVTVGLRRRHYHRPAPMNFHP